MKNSSNKEQYYALDSSGNIVYIQAANPDKEAFFCLHCYQQMVAKQGKVRQWHFAHKVLSPNCSYESYLHSLAKFLILQKLRSEQSFRIEITAPFSCANKETCLWYEDSCKEPCKWTGYKNFDLKKFYNTFEVESAYDNFRADILLSNSIKKFAPVFIEIYVSHPCEQQKIDSGNKIIELKINSEDDIKSIVDSSIITEDGNRIRFYNFNPPEEASGPPPHLKPLLKFSVYESLKMYCSYTDCLNFTQHNRKAIFELTLDTSFNFSSKTSLYDYGALVLYEHDNTFQVCNLCRYHRTRDMLCDDLWDTELDWRPIFCCLYKKLGINKYRDPSDARTCSAYRRMDEKMKAEIKQGYEQVKIICWKRSDV